MTLVLIGPVCEDLIIIGEDKSSKVGGANFYQSSKVGGANFYQSFVYEEYFDNYLAIVNASNNNLIDSFPDKSKVKLILKEDTHYFINEYPNRDDLDIRKQSTNFADIPISIADLKSVFKDCSLNKNNIDAFVLNPLNCNDFDMETIEYLKSFDVPIFISLQGFLRFEGEDNSIVLKPSPYLKTVFEIADMIFLDEDEFEVIRQYDSFKNIEKYDDLRLLITNGSKGSRIIDVDGTSIKINAVKSNNIVDATGCGDTYMAAYISGILKGKSLQESGDFASMIASRKLEKFGPYKK